MAVIANLARGLGKGTRKIEVITATGPAADVSVGAGVTANLDISISPELGNVEEVIVESISGLPDNILANQIGFSTTAVTLRAVNPTAAAITITANSLTIRAVVIGY